MRTTKRRWQLYALLGLILVLPLAAGCPELRNEAVTVLENAAREFLNGALDQVFAGLRADNL